MCLTYTVSLASVTCVIRIIRVIAKVVNVIRVTKNTSKIASKLLGIPYSVMPMVPVVIVPEVTLTSSHAPSAL